jgi:hypothetical protein
MKVFFTLFSLIILQGCVSANLDGAFPSTEFIYRFVDSNSLPVSGVSLEVVNSDGVLAYNYPIREFTGQNSVISTSEGVLKFSHLNKGFEFGGECFGFGIFKYGACSAPEFKLIFKLKGKEVYSIKYSDLSGLGSEISIKRIIY